MSTIQSAETSPPACQCWNEYQNACLLRVGARQDEQLPEERWARWTHNPHGASVVTAVTTLLHVESGQRSPAAYHRWRRPDCIRTEGDTDCGGLGIVNPWPLAGLMMGMALAFRARVA